MATEKNVIIRKGIHNYAEYLPKAKIPWPLNHHSTPSHMHANSNRSIVGTTLVEEHPKRNADQTAVSIQLMINSRSVKRKC